MDENDLVMRASTSEDSKGFERRRSFWRRFWNQILCMVSSAWYKEAR